MQKKFEINRTNIKGGCQSARKVVTHNSKSDLPLHLFGVHVGWLDGWGMLTYCMQLYKQRAHYYGRLYSYDFISGLATRWPHILPVWLVLLKNNNKKKDPDYNLNLNVFK